ncbi:isochorismatase family protein [Nocardiopsis sp. EMB25]|uniref:isochorismatase family protein n=1 Tax=Nocardiopsis sp. EMB25 TaxID=2835867 RepID=UPI002284D3CB|nr:isochorismatase family protein [Nocardiopsis sp. EMB25]MCY9782815.1 isochorismatase family protein [Nocardiopsis sp. EMB25]
MTFALMFVDVQRNMLQGQAPVPDAAAVRPVLGRLLDRARAAGAVVVHVLNDGGDDDPDRPFTPGWEPVFPHLDGERVVRKTEANTFSVPGLADAFRSRGVATLVVCGFQSQMCVLETSLGGRREGFGVILASGAHATYPDRSGAAEIAAAVEREHESSGIKVSHARGIDFR